MTTTKYKTLPKRIKTSHTGIYYKEIEKTVIDAKGNIKTSISDRVYSIQYKDTDGSWKFKTIGKKSEGIRENYCKTERIKILNATNLGEQPDIIKKKKPLITLNEVFEKYKEEQINHGKKFKSTEKNYNSHLKPYFGEKSIFSITTDSIVKFRSYLENEVKLAQSTRNIKIQLIKTLFNYAIEEKLYDLANPVNSKKFVLKKTDNKRERFLATNEVKDLLEAIKDDEIVSLFVKLSLSTGGRLETILNIQKKDINLDTHIVTLKDLKNNDTYTGFLNNEICLELSERINTLNPNSYIIGRDLIKYPSRTIQRKLKNVFDPLFNKGLDSKDAKNRTVIHTLRHTFASHLAINGTPIFTIQKLMNHKDIEMTMRYAKLAPDSGKESVQNLYK